MVRGAPLDVFETDVSPARRHGPVAGLARIPLHLAARPLVGAEDRSEEDPWVVTEMLIVPLFDPDRLGLDGRHPADAVVGAEDRVAGGLRRIGGREAVESDRPRPST